MAYRNGPSVASVFPEELIQLARSQGASTDTLERRVAPLSKVIYQDYPELKYEFMHSLMLELWRLHPDELLGFKAGLNIPPTSPGCMGMAFLSAGTLREAIENLDKYWPVIGRGLSFRYEVLPDSVEVTLSCSLETDAFLARWITETGLGALWRGLCLVVGDTKANEVRILSRFSEPDDIKDQELPIALTTFNSIESQIIFPEHLLNHGFSMSSQRGLRRALDECDREIQLVQGDGIVSRKVSTVLTRYRSDFPDLEKVAELLCMQARTLRRALSVEKTSYSKLLEEHMLKLALKMLRLNTLSIAEISEQLGYSEASSFYRAFRRWTGVTPAEARETLITRE